MTRFYRGLLAVATFVLVLGFNYPSLGNPMSPQPLLGIANRAVIAYDNKTGTGLFNTSDAHHGPNCEGPEVQHTLPAGNQVDRVYVCHDHWMTNAYSVGTGAVYVVLDHMMDISNGQTSTLHWNMSTYRSSSRDWVDFDIQPQESMLLVNGQNGTSLRTGIHGSTDSQGPFNANPGNSHFGVQIYRDWDHENVPMANTTPWERVVPDNSFPTAAVQRQGFDVVLSKTHIRVGMPTYNLWWVDSDINPPLDWDYGVVSLNHRSYNAGKACPDANIQGPCGADSWHWGGESVDPSVPFTMIHSPNLWARNGESTVRFNAPAPAGSSLFFAAVASTRPGENIQISLTGGQTWQNMPILDQCNGCYLGDEWHHNYRLDGIPAGLQEIRLRSANGAANWVARDFEVFNFGAQPVGPSPTTAPTPQATGTPTVSPTAESTPSPTSEPLPTAVATATSQPSATPTAGPRCYEQIVVAPDGSVTYRGEVPC